MKKLPPIKLDTEEKELSDSFDKGEWVSVKHLEEEINLAKKIAKNTLKKLTHRPTKQ
jgi:hypothetical protein